MDDEQPAAPQIGNRAVARGLGTTLVSRLGSAIEIVAQPVYVAMFGLASYGFYAVMWAMINLLENVLDLGMTSAMQRTVPQAHSPRAAAASLRAAMVLGVLPCLGAAALIALFAPQVAQYLNVAPRDAPLLVPALRLFIWALPLWAFVEIATSSLRAQQVFGAEIRLRIFWEQLIRLALAVVAWALGFGLMGLFVAHMVSLTVTSLLAARLVLRYFAVADIVARPFWPPIATETARAGLAVLPANTLARLFSDAPALVLNILLPGAAGAAAGGLFTIARKISSIVQLVRTAFAYVLAPLVSSAVRHDPAQVRAIYGFATRLIAAIVIPLAAVLAAGVLPVLALFGPDARQARAAVVMMIAARAIEATVGASVPVQQVVGGYSRQLIASSLGALIALLSGFWLAALLAPLTAISLATSIGLVCAAAIPMVQLAWADGLHPFHDRFAHLLGAACGAAALGVVLMLPTGSLPNLVGLLLLLPVAALAMWLSMRIGLPLDDRHALGKTGRRLRLFD